jgi:hypothetical protein
MRFIYAFRDFLQTWQGTALTGIAILGTFYYGPRKMLETWDWYWDRYRDNEVLFIISRRKTIPRPGGGFPYLGKHPPPPPQTMELPFHRKEIADYLGRSEKSVRKSLKRLKRRGKIEPLSRSCNTRRLILGIGSCSRCSTA